MKTKEQKKGFLSRILEFFVGVPLSAADARQILKFELALNRMGYHFYTRGKDRMLSAYMDFVYNIYETVAPLRNFFLERNEDEYYKALVINYSLDNTQRNLVERLSTEKLTEATKINTIKDVTEAGKKDLQALFATFTTDNSARINNLYKSVIILKQLCVLDYYPILKLSCNDFIENNFSSKPRFKAVARRYVADFSSDLINDVVSVLDVDNWEAVFNFLSNVTGFPKEYSFQFFGRILKDFAPMEQRDAFSMLACIVHLDPKYELQAFSSGKNIVSPYLDSLLQNFKETMQNIAFEKKRAQFSSMINQAFGGAEIKPLKFYNEKESKLYTDRDVQGFKFCTAMSYLSTFCEKQLKGDIEDVYDALNAVAKYKDAAIDREWDKAYHSVIDLYKGMLKFDQQLDVKFSAGYQLKSMLEKCKNDEATFRKLNIAISDVNAEAEAMLRSARKKFGLLEEYVKIFLKDSQSDAPKVLSNWNDLKKRLKDEPAVKFNMIARSLAPFLMLIENYAKM